MNGQLWIGQETTDYKIFKDYLFIRDTEKSRLIKLSTGNSYWISKKHSYIKENKLYVEDWFWCKFLRHSNKVLNK